MVNNFPRQLKIKRKKYYDKYYSRQPQLMKRLIPLLNESDIIEKNTEPFLHSLNYPLKEKLDKKIDKKKKLRKELNKFQSSRALMKRESIKKISEVRPDVLYGLGMKRKNKRKLWRII